MMYRILIISLTAFALAACSLFHSNSKGQVESSVQTASPTEVKAVEVAPTPTPQATTSHKKKQKYFYYRAKHRCLEKELRPKEKLEDCIQRLKNQ